jgi:hypothetical protein
MAGFSDTARDRLGALRVKLKCALAIIWSNRTKITGYVGVVLGVIQATQGQPHSIMFLGAVVACIGHYNDSIRDVRL